MSILVDMFRRRPDLKPRIILSVIAITVSAGAANIRADEPVCKTLQDGASCTAQYAATINPYRLLNIERSELIDRFPALSERERDLLWFKISDIKSQRSLD